MTFRSYFHQQHYFPNDVVKCDFMFKWKQIIKFVIEMRYFCGVET